MCNKSLGLLYQEKWDNKRGENTLNISYETHLKEGNLGGGTFGTGVDGVCQDVARPLANIFRRHLHLCTHNTSNNLMRIHHNRRGSIRSSDLLQFDTFHNVPCWLVDFRWWCCPASARHRSTPRSNSWRMDLEFGTPARESDLFRRKWFHRLVLTWRRWVPLKHVVNKWWRNNNEHLFKPYCQLGSAGRRQSAANETQWVTSVKQPSPQDCWALNNNYRSFCISCEREHIRLANRNKIVSARNRNTTSGLN